MIRNITEIVTRKNIPEKIFNAAAAAGVLLLLTLFLVATVSDVMRIFG